MRMTLLKVSPSQHSDEHGWSRWISVACTAEEGLVSPCSEAVLSSPPLFSSDWRAAGVACRAEQAAPVRAHVPPRTAQKSCSREPCWLNVEGLNLLMSLKAHWQGFLSQGQNYFAKKYTLPWYTLKFSLSLNILLIHYTTSCDCFASDCYVRYHLIWWCSVSATNSHIHQIDAFDKSAMTCKLISESLRRKLTSTESKPVRAETACKAEALSSLLSKLQSCRLLSPARASIPILVTEVHSLTCGDRQ